MDITLFRDRLVALNTDILISLYKECTPSVLVVTDTLRFGSTEGFGLSQFVNTLKASTIHGMTPKVTTASCVVDAAADISNYDFTHASNGLIKSRYDVVFLFGVRMEGDSPLSAAQVEAIAKFMEAGGGVFATGDHETLGASMCGDIPRVRSMRKWKGASMPPNVSSTARFSTNLSGPNESEEFSDQSNTEPQRLYVNYRTQAGGLGQPHPLLQLKSPRRVLEVYPDHPHEGQCVVPTALGTSFTVGGSSVAEWPADAAGSTVVPEVVAMSVSNGDGFTIGGLTKAPLVPQLFASIVAYDGHRAGKGRVSTDSTWHHFININLDGTGEPGFSGLQAPPGTDTEALIRIRQHYVNLATWLMPKSVRKCLRFPVVLSELARYPLFEELDVPALKQASAAQLATMGEQVAQSLMRRTTRWEAQALLADALEDAVGPEQAAKWLEQAEGLAGFKGVELAHAALGGVVSAMAMQLAELKDVQQIKPHETFDKAAQAGARQATKLALQARRDQLKQLDEVLGRLEQPLR
jgi:hypothetical protein